jgi:hypothetical protein
MSRLGPQVFMGGISIGECGESTRTDEGCLAAASQATMWPEVVTWLSFIAHGLKISLSSDLISCYFMKSLSWSMQIPVTNMPNFIEV